MRWWLEAIFTADRRPGLQLGLLVYAMYVPARVVIADRYWRRPGLIYRRDPRGDAIREIGEEIESPRDRSHIAADGGPWLIVGVVATRGHDQNLRDSGSRAGH